MSCPPPPVLSSGILTMASTKTGNILPRPPVAKPCAGCMAAMAKRRLNGACRASASRLDQRADHTAPLFRFWEGSTNMAAITLTPPPPRTGRKPALPLAAWFTAIGDWRRARAAGSGSFGALPDHILDDLGLGRGDILNAVRHGGAERERGGPRDRPSSPAAPAATPRPDHPSGRIGATSPRDPLRDRIGGQHVGGRPSRPRCPRRG